MNLKGEEQTVVHEKSRESFNDCMTFHLLTVFASNVAEQQRFFISNVLKKPARVPMRHFLQHVEPAISCVSPDPTTAHVQLHR